MIVKNTELPVITFLFGAEEFLIEESLGRLTGKFIPDYKNNYNFKKISSSEITFANLIDLANSFPMLGSEQFIIIKDFENYFKGRISKDNINLKILNKYLENPPTTTKLIILCTDSKLNGLTKKKTFKIPAHYKLLIEKSNFIEFPKIYPNNFHSWLDARFAKFGKTADRETVELIISQTNESLRDLANQVYKIINYVGENEKIVAKEIMDLVGQSKENNIFELQKSVSERNIKKSIKISENMLTYSRQEIYIVSVMTNFFRSVLRLTEATSLSSDKFEIARTIGASPYFMDDYYKALRNYSLAEIENNFIHLTGTDIALKSTSEGGMSQITKLLVKIMEH
jgi:DNA polymerase III subunit delta